MSTTLLTFGVACIVAAIVGGGLKAFQIEIPALRSLTRQVMLATFGLAMVLAAYVIQQSTKSNPQPSENDPLKAQSAGIVRDSRAQRSSLPQLKMGTWTLSNAITTDPFTKVKTDWSGSTLKFTNQVESEEGLKLEGFFEWRVGGVLHGTEEVEGYYVSSTRQLYLEGKSVHQALPLTDANLGIGPASYSAVLSEDTRLLGDGHIRNVAQKDPVEQGRWQASR